MSVATNYKVWHPAYDAYHCAHRVLRLLVRSTDHSIAIETLCILDFYLLYPALLHRASMPEGVRAAFRELRIPRDKDQFVQLPSSQSLFRDLSVFQRAAISGLAAKGLLDREQYLSGTATLLTSAVPQRLLHSTLVANELDEGLTAFLVNQFGTIDLIGSRGLRALTGLVRRR